jgi:hypothetical protein
VLFMSVRLGACDLGFRVSGSGFGVKGLGLPMRRSECVDGFRV